MSLLQTIVHSFSGDASEANKVFKQVGIGTKDREIRDDAIGGEEEKKDAKFEITNLKQVKESTKRQTTGDDSSASHSSVSFGSVEVREYERVMDSSGVYLGLALGWDYNEKPAMPVNTTKVKNHVSSYTAGQHGGEHRMKRTNGSQRYGMMLRYGYQRKEMKKATAEAAEFHQQRSREAARSLVVADKKKNNDNKPRRRTLRSMFG